MNAPLVARVSGGFLIGALAAASLVAQPAASRVRWRPGRVVQGALIELELTPAAGERVRAVHGELAGEPLHFGGRSVLTSLAGIPVDAGDTLATTLVIEHAARAETLSVHIPVSHGAFSSSISPSRRSSAPNPIRSPARASRASWSVPARWRVAPTTRPNSGAARSWRHARGG